MNDELRDSRKVPHRPFAADGRALGDTRHRACLDGLCLSEADLTQRVDRFTGDLIEASRIAEESGTRGFDGLEPTVVALAEIGTTVGGENRDELCRVFTQFPNFELAPQRVVEALGGVPGGAEADGCLSLPPDLLVALMVDYFVLRETELVLGAICDATQCLPLACKVS